MKYLLLSLLFTLSAWAQTPETKGKVIYQYKKYEKFDMGNLDLNGELIVPGEVSVRERERFKINMDLFERKKTNDFKTSDAQSLE